MNGPSRRPAALVVAVAVVLSGACVPTPTGRATPEPITSPSPAAATSAPTSVASGPTPAPSFVRPTPTPLPTFLGYVVKSGDTLDAIAKAHGTTLLSLAFWNRATYPSLDPDSPAYEPNRIKVGWVLLMIPDTEIDEDSTFPE